MVVLTYCSYYHRGLNNEKKTNFGLNRIFAKKRNLSTFTEKQTEKCSSIFNIFSINPLSRRTRNIKKHSPLRLCYTTSFYKPYNVIFTLR